MRKFLLVFSAAMMSSIAANAAIVACDPVSPISYSYWSQTFVGVGNGCQLGDKIFSNFSLGAPSNTSLTFGSLGNSFTINYTQTAAGGFAQSFTESYDISICYAPCITGTAAPNANWKIVRVAAGLQDSNANGNASIAKSLTVGTTPVGVASATDVSGVVTPVVLNGIKASSLHVVDQFNYTSGIITNISNTFTQADTTVPEPATGALLGGALIALGLLRRR